MTILEKIYNTTLKGSHRDMEDLVKKAVEAGEKPNDIINRATYFADRLIFAIFSRECNIL